jgi:hypothetical protein
MIFQQPVWAESWRVFVDFCVRAESEEIRDTADVVMVPMRKQARGDGGVVGFEDGGEASFPRQAAFARVEQDACTAAAK